MYDWLKGARRVAAAVSGKPDCVPIYGPLPDHALHLAGIPSEKGCQTRQQWELEQREARKQTEEQQGVVGPPQT